MLIYEVSEQTINDSIAPIYPNKRFGWESLWIEAYEDVEIDLYREVMIAYLTVMSWQATQKVGIPTYRDLTDILDVWFYERINEQIISDLEQDGRSPGDIEEEEWEELEMSYLDFASYNQYYDCFSWQVSQCIKNLRLTIIDDGYYEDDDFTIINDAQIELLPEGDDVKYGSEDGHRFNRLPM